MPTVLLLNESAYPTWSPGCFSPFILEHGYGGMTTKVAQIHDENPWIESVLILDPFGRHVVRDMDHNAQTVIDQHRRCLADARTRHIGDPWQFTLFVRALRARGLGVECYVGWEPEGYTPEQLVADMAVFIANRIPTFHDGLSVRPDSRWLMQMLRVWGSPWAGVEAIPDDPALRSRSIRACCLDELFMRTKRPPNPTTIIFNNQVPIPTLKAAMRKIDRLAIAVQPGQPYRPEGTNEPEPDSD